MPIVFVCCNDNRKEVAYNSSEIQNDSSIKSNKAPKTSIDQTAVLVRSNLHGKKATSLEGIRDMILEVSEKSGLAYGECLCQVYFSASVGSSENEAIGIARILSGTVDGKPELLVSVLACAPAGKLRKQFVASALGGYYDFSHTPPIYHSYPLEDIYMEMPESSDREQIAVFRVGQVFLKDGLKPALSLIKNLRTQEEKKAAMTSISMELHERNADGNAYADDVKMLRDAAKSIGLEKDVPNPSP